MRAAWSNEHFRAHAATSSILDRVGGGRWLAIGDAATVYDPIASQGIHKALPLQAPGAT